MLLQVKAIKSFVSGKDTFVTLPLSTSLLICNHHTNDFSSVEGLVCHYEAAVGFAVAAIWELLMDCDVITYIIDFLYPVVS